jgi:hypothetical protein
MTLLFVLSLHRSPLVLSPRRIRKAYFRRHHQFDLPLPPSSIRPSYPCHATPQHPAHSILCTDVQITLEPLLAAPEALTADIRATNIGSTSSPLGIIYTSQRTWLHTILQTPSDPIIWNLTSFVHNGYLWT